LLVNTRFRLFSLIRALQTLFDHVFLYSTSMTYCIVICIAIIPIALVFLSTYLFFSVHTFFISGIQKWRCPGRRVTRSSGAPRGTAPAGALPFNYWRGTYTSKLEHGQLDLSRAVHGATCRSALKFDKVNSRCLCLKK
jgi:hypothetical protein